MLSIAASRSMARRLRGLWKCLGDGIAKMKEEYLAVAEIAEKLKIKKPTTYQISHEIGCLKLVSGQRVPVRVRSEDYERWTCKNLHYSDEDSIE